MTRKPVVFLSALALATLGLAACGGDEGGNGQEATSSPAAASEEAPEETGDAEEQEQQDEQEGSSEEGESASEEYAEEGTEEDADDGTDEEAEGDDAASDSEAADPGPAAEGAVIPAGAVSEPPAEIGEFELMDGSGPAHIYSHTEDSIMVSLDSNVLSSSYEDLVGEIETDNVAAGTGSCGTNGSGTSITCYQRTEDGVVTLTGVPEELSVEEMAVFVNQYADTVGAA